jgi:hypothetical protein
MRSLMNTLGSLTQTIQRNPWSSAQDAALLAATLAVGFLLALEYEIVAFWDQLNADQKRIRFEEMLLLTGLLGAGIFFFLPSSCAGCTRSGATGSSGCARSWSCAKVGCWPCRTR